MLKTLLCTACVSTFAGLASLGYAQEPKVSVQVDAPSSDNQGQQEDTFRVTSVLGTEVQNKEGEKLGQVKDLVVDATSHQIAYIVLARGESEELMAVPSGAFMVHKHEKAKIAAQPAGHAHPHYFVLNVPVEAYQKAPKFTVTEWNETYITPQWRTQIDTYYQPYVRARGPIERRINRAERALDRAQDRAEDKVERAVP